MGEIRARTLEIEARSQFNLGNYTAARQHFEQALKTARRIDLRVIISRLLTGLGAVARRLGDYDESELYARECLVLCLEIGQLAGTAAAYAALGDVAYHRGKLEEARTNHEQALAIYRQLGDLHGIADQALSVAFILFEEGEVEEAEAMIQEAYQIGEKIDTEMVMTRAYYHLAKVARSRGEMASAQLLVKKAIEIADRAGIQMMKALGLRLLGEFLEREQTVQPEQYFQECLALLEKLGERFEVAWTLRSFADFLCQRGEVERAKTLYQQAISIFETIGAERERTITLGNLNTLISEK